MDQVNNESTIKPLLVTIILVKIALMSSAKLSVTYYCRSHDDGDSTEVPGPADAESPADLQRHRTERGVRLHAQQEPRASHIPRRLRTQGRRSR